MKQREYHIKIYSISRFVITLSIVFCLICILVVDYIPHIKNSFFSILSFVLIFAISFYVALCAGIAKVRVVFTDDFFLHIWEKTFLLSMGKNIKIPWNIMDNYVFEEDRGFDSFTINLTTNQRYKVNKFTVIPIKDDFEQLVKDFPRYLNKYRKKNVSDNDATLCCKGESMYTNRHVRGVFYFLSIVFLILLIAKILNPEFGTNWRALGVIGSGLLFYGITIRKHNKGG